MKKYIAISRYDEDIEWTKDFPIPCVINRSTCGHESTVLQHIYDNYVKLPDVIVFAQAYPYDHCNLEKFNKLVFNNKFTSLESYENEPENDYYKKSPLDKGYTEINNSWYIPAHNSTHNIVCKYSSYDDFMDSYFKNYTRVDWIRFAPGSQFVVEKRNILNYSREFWRKLADELPRYNMTESFIIERALYYIFTNRFEERC